MPTNFLGTTRFSLYEPTSPSWRLSRKDGRSDQDRYKRRLFSPDRMKSRIEIFFDHSLPLLAQGSRDHKLVHVVSFSEELPPQYRDYLENAVQQYDWLRLDCRGPENRRGISLDDLARESFSPGETYAEYRLDDDDLLASTYFDTLSSYVSESHVGFYVSFGLGIQAFYRDQTFLEPRIEHRPKIAIGLARICRVEPNGKITGPRRVSHTQSDRHAPIIVDSQSFQFLHTLHLSQDSGVDKPDGDLGNRIRNYLNQEKPESGTVNELFTDISVASMSDAEQVKLILGAHARTATLGSTLRKIKRRISFYV